MKCVVLESPYSGNIERNIIYARRAVKDSLSRGESPSPMHLVHTQPGILDDNNPEERAWGIAAHLAWIPLAEAVVLYTDYGISPGMDAAVLAAARAGVPLMYRKIGENP